MSKADEFLKWCSERMGHPAQINFAREAINEQKKEINELKAYIEITKNAYSNLTYGTAGIDNLLDSISDTPRQCLANVKADAVEGLANTFIEEWPAHTGKYDWMIGTAIMMRKTMITTSSESSLSEVVNKINEEL